MVAGKTPATGAATNLVMPIGALWLVLMGCWIGTAAMRQRVASVAFASCCLGLTICGNGRIAGYLVSQIETPEVIFDSQTRQPLSCVAVLGGGVSVTSAGTAELNRDGERVVSAAQFWHSGLTKTIICTGASAVNEYDPNVVGRDLLITMDVPPEHIFQIGGENTSEELVNLKEFLNSPPDSFWKLSGDGDVGLITSAFHMPRALRLAKQQGLELTPIPTCFRSSIWNPVTPGDLIPTAGACDTISIVLKEHLAKSVGR